MADLEKEQSLSKFLDTQYHKHLKNYTFKRANDRKSQFQGIDLVLTNNLSGKNFYVDEKAQLDYINEDLPTFAFELSYLKNNERKEGWLFDNRKATDFYFLITSIFTDEPDKFTSCKITIVNRKKLVLLLGEKGISKSSLDALIDNNPKNSKKMKIKGLESRNEGYLYFSSQNKVEKPVNLILKLDFLIENKVAKRMF